MQKLRDSSSGPKKKFLAGEPVDPDRSALMARVLDKNSKPEIVVRQLVHALGYRFRLHRRNLPGTPDLVFPSAQKAIFVHGCFWHRHKGCSRATTPTIRAAFWRDKFTRNVERDSRKAKALRGIGWKILVVWECETFDPKPLATRLSAFLRYPRQRTGSLQKNK